jgi:hypothetical protein
MQTWGENAKPKPFRLCKRRRASHIAPRSRRRRDASTDAGRNGPDIPTAVARSDHSRDSRCSIQQSRVGCRTVGRGPSHGFRPLTFTFQSIDGEFPARPRPYPCYASRRGTRFVFDPDGSRATASRLASAAPARSGRHRRAPDGARLSAGRFPVFPSGHSVSHSRRCATRRARS